MEIDAKGRLNFLDTTVIIDENRIIFDKYHKPTFSARFLNFYSHHPYCHKRSVIIGAVDKIVLLSHPRFHQKNLTEAINIFLENVYPLDFIFSTIRKRLNYHIYYNNNNTDINLNKKIKATQKYFTVPYVKDISESFLPIAFKLGCKLSYTIPNSLKNYIKRGKDQLDSLSHQGVVYKIFCEDCEASYVGQTKRRLKSFCQKFICHSVLSFIA
ncbi:hypothetical protein ALC57_00467 [Trachymyrmex cornetzi]|uniref:Helix-turn-helix domain-containing protein n=1 Tax=Trachymyrmex cornetzi TaxID=471704 RepID=A0A151JS10_9HYME|nr:hypothetical protein ALC57_00467 [Trachymyrmex cornetzi]